MILAFSTSSPMSSVAAISDGGEVVWSGSQIAPRAASKACLELLGRMKTEANLSVQDASLFLADYGPGSFTGVRVGVILAKTFAWLFDRQVSGASAFDLISTTQTVALPSRRDEYFIRRPGEQPVRCQGRPADAVGYGLDGFIYPLAESFAKILPDLAPTGAIEFLPQYLIDPSISQPKKPYAGT